MKRLPLLFTVLSLTLAFFFLAWVEVQEVDPYFKISKKDIRLRIPPGFPEPAYDFSKNKITPAGFVLGRKLFYDPILSRDSSTSCGSCHQRIAAFGHIDHKLSHGINGLIGTRNVPALQNLIWAPNFMWDGGITHLDLQPLAPITNPTEMGESIENVLIKLRKHTEYPKLFRKAFHQKNITTALLTRALSQFMALMISDSARYDQYCKDGSGFSAPESRGLKVFRMHCASCHPEPLFTDYQWHDIGLQPDAALSDYGLGKMSGISTDSMRFRTPSLRNVAITPPYMHDGRFRNLQQVVAHYNSAPQGFRGNDPLLAQAAGLSPAQQQDLLAFLNTLTDRHFTYDRRFIEPYNP
ncbi:MAG: c-type cytochrome [Bacteroidetes bacterium]|nr:c-type cytochrome [Bacteroidota bacterium]